MPHVINGVATNGVPTGLTVPGDGDDWLKAADIEVPIQGLLDGEANLKARLDAQTGVTAPVVFTATTATVWTSGPNDRRIELEGWGGGGGGGGAGGSTTSTTSASGGGGGGASLARRVVLEIQPNTAYEALVGAAGTGGSAGAIGNGAGGDGAAGGDTIFRVQGGAELARIKGAIGGRGGVCPTNNTPALAPGGAPSNQFRPTAQAANRFAANASLTDGSAGLTYCYGPGFGGEGINRGNGDLAGVRAGADSREGFAGGSGGIAGTNNTYLGGGGGGGGAAGPGGNGTGGIPGGDGAATGTASPGSGASTAPAANSGAGGGGGGGGGSVNGTPGAGGTGRPGAAGKLTLRVIG